MKDCKHFGIVIEYCPTAKAWGWVICHSDGKIIHEEYGYSSIHAAYHESCRWIANHGSDDIRSAMSITHDVQIH